MANNKDNRENDAKNAKQSQKDEAAKQTSFEANKPGEDDNGKTGSHKMEAAQKAIADKGADDLGSGDDLAFGDRIGIHDDAIKSEVQKASAAFKDGDKEKHEAALKRITELTSEMSTHSTGAAMQIDNHESILEQMRAEHENNINQRVQMAVEATRGHEEGTVAPGDQRDGTHASVHADLSSRPMATHGDRRHRVIDRPLTPGANG